MAKPTSSIGEDLAAAVDLGTQLMIAMIKESIFAKNIGEDMKVKLETTHVLTDSKSALRHRAQSGGYQEVDARRALADVRARPLPDEGDRTHSRPDAPHDGRRND